LTGEEDFFKKNPFALGRLGEGSYRTKKLKETREKKQKDWLGGIVKVGFEEKSFPRLSVYQGRKWIRKKREGRAWGADSLKSGGTLLGWFLYLGPGF